MTTVTIYADPAGGNDWGMDAADSVYLNARAASGGANAVGNPIVGQYLGSFYHCCEAFVGFDTSTIATAISAILSIYITGDGTVTDLTAEARVHDWGTDVTSADFVAGASLGSKTLVATLSTSGLTSSAYNNFTESSGALASNLNLSGYTRLLINSDRHRLGTAPTVDEIFNFYRAGDNLSNTTNDPKIIITTSADPSTDNILNPDQDAAINSWTTDTGDTSDLWNAIDETAASDADYIQSPVGPTSASYYETALETHADPSSSSGHIVHYRYQKNVSGGNVDLTASLRQGGEKLTVNQRGLETDTTGWAATGGNTTITRSLAQAHAGVASLALTATGNGDVSATTPQGLLGFRVTPDVPYVLSAQMRSTVARVCSVFIEFYDSGGNVIDSHQVGDTTSISAWTSFSGSGTVDPLSVYGAVIIEGATLLTGEVLYADSISFLHNFVAVDSWTHTNISNSWTTQNQTLSGAEADSITDYSDLRLRFTPSTTTSDQAPTYVADRASDNNNSAVTTVDLVLTSLTVGNYLIIRSAADNSGGGGAARTLTVTNQSGSAMGTHTEYQQNNDPGAASAGTTCNVSVIKIAATSGTIRLTYSGSVVQACVAEEWTGIDATTPVVGTPTQTSAVADTNLATNSDASVAAGNVAYAVCSVEGPSTDSYTFTSPAGWAGMTKVGNTNATADTNQTTVAGYHLETTTTSDQWQPTVGTARDSASIQLELKAAPSTIKTQVSWANLELPSATRKPGLSAGMDSGFGMF